MKSVAVLLAAVVCLQVSGRNVSGFPQAVVSEFDNVATASALDGSASSPNSTTAGSITTTTPGEVFGEVAIDFNTINGVEGSGYVLDSVVNAFDDDNPGHGGTSTSTLDEDNGCAHLYNTSTSPVSFVWTYNNSDGGSLPSAYWWAGVAVSFEATAP